jgi:hypothetical protein
MLLIAGLTPMAGLSAVEGAQSAKAAPVQVTAPAQVPVFTQTSFSALSDQQLNAVLATKWDVLGEDQRRALLSEVKLRMARHKGRERVINLQEQRRYGLRVIRQRNGSVVRIQTQVVRVRPAPNGEGSFGVGFEERTKQAPPVSTEPSAPPVMTVNDAAP